ncbi:MAG: hypothetical protein ACKO2P_09450, partial [Planctomycetota bacterium]
MTVRLRFMTVVATLTLFTVASTQNQAKQPPDFDHTIRPYLQKYCVTCHSADRQQGSFRVDTLSPDVA